MTIFFSENGFYDDQICTPPDNAVLLTDNQYKLFLNLNYRGAKLTVENGSVVARNYKDELISLSDDTPQSRYNAPQSLTNLAQSALSDVQSQAPMMVAMGESFGPKTKSYVQALQAIINGTDTTSTELPTKPDHLTA